MPGYEIPLRNNAQQVILRYNDVDYPIDIDEHGFTRVGEDGTIKLLSLFADEEFYAEYLEPHWHKGWNEHIDADQPFTAIVDTTDHQLFMQGEADVAGTAGEGWVKSYLPCPLIDELEITVAMSVPIDDTGAVASRDIKLGLNLSRDKNETNPNDDDDRLTFMIHVDETGLILLIYKRIDGALTTLFDGKTYDDAVARGTGDVEAVVWRIVFHGKPSTSGAHMHVYLKQSDTIDNAEGSTENELTSSPFDVDDILFHTVFPSAYVYSQNAAYFDSGSEAKVGYIRVSYPDFEVVPNGDRFENEVEIWDGDPESSGKRVRDIDHIFSGEPHLKNGLLQVEVNATSGGIVTKFWRQDTEVWQYAVNQYWAKNQTEGQDLKFVSLEKIVYMSPEKVKLLVTFRDSTTLDNDYFLEGYLTLERGNTVFEFDPIKTYPTGDIRITAYISTASRFAYIGDDGIADDDLSLSKGNSTMSDNFMTLFDNAGLKAVVVYAVNKKPNSQFYSFSGDMVRSQDIPPVDLVDTKLWCGFVYFALIANLFEEAEDATISGAVREFIDADHDGFTGIDDDMVTEAQPEAGHAVLYDDDETFWGAYNSGVGSYECAVAEETTIKRVGTSSLEIVVGAGANANTGFRHTYGAPEDLSANKYFGFWWYGANNSETWKITIVDDDGDFADWDFTDDFSGWRWLCFEWANPDTETGTFDNSIVVEIRVWNTSVASTGTAYIDYFIIFDGLWTEQANTTITINDETDPQVNNYAVKVEATATAWTHARVNPISPIGNLLKFDSIKLYLHGENGETIWVRLYDADGDYIEKSIVITPTATEYTEEIPHNASEITSLSWQEGGTFDFSTFTYILFVASQTNGEIYYVDGLHFYIGTTTTKGRGETLSGSDVVVLDASGELVYYDITAGTDLPAGRYLAVFRTKDTDQVASDPYIYVRNVTDGNYRNEDAGNYTLTFTDAFVYYVTPFFISDADVSDGDTIRVLMVKDYAAENTIFVDYIVLPFLGDGESGPMDLAHNALRVLSLERRIEKK